MKKFILFSIAAGFLVACGGGKKDSEAEKDPNSIKLPVEAQVGELTDYATFPNELKIKLRDQQTEPSESQKLEAVTNVSLDVNEAVASDFNYRFIISVVDADYSTIASSKSSGFKDSYEFGIKDRHKVILSKGIQRQDFEFELTSQEWDNIKTNGAHIIIKPEWNNSFKRYSDLSRKDSNDTEENSISSETEVNDVSSSDDSSGGDFDDLLDSFERYVDKYITFMKKAKDGDASAMSEYPGLLKEAQDYSKKIQNVKGQLTADQIEKYQRINNKMLKAAQKLQ